VSVLGRGSFRREVERRGSLGRPILCEALGPHNQANIGIVCQVADFHDSNLLEHTAI
jgi:hypothetical protein